MTWPARCGCRPAAPDVGVCHATRWQKMSSERRQSSHPAVRSVAPGGAPQEAGRPSGARGPGQILYRIGENSLGPLAARFTASASSHFACAGTKWHPGEGIRQPQNPSASALRPDTQLEIRTAWCVASRPAPQRKIQTGRAVHITFASHSTGKLTDRAIKHR